jgi:uncharacterized membrane protein YphA (DoxX/SURF4 family)
VNRPSKIFLTLLRIAIGWHFLYEGVWKVDSDTGAPSYATSWYILHSSVARLRADLPGMKAESAAARADAWYDEVVKAFKGRNQPLGEDQKGRLAGLRDQIKLAAWTGDAPVAFDWIYVRDAVLHIAAAQQAERFTAEPFLASSAGPFRPLFRGLVRDIDGFQRLTLTSAQSALDDRYREIVKHYGFTEAQQQKLAQVRDTLKTSLAATLDDPGFRARLEDYAAMRRRVAADRSLTTAPFSRERLAEDRKKMDVIAAELLGFVEEPLAELAVQSQTIATVDQLGLGPLPLPSGQTPWIDAVIQYGLIAMGACLLLGLFTPVAALAAATQLALFYFASPPWPELPATTLGGHYLFVDRNLIELFAALAIAVTGSGRWAGLDAYVSRWFHRRAQTAPAPSREEVLA